jgi:hypothetical protein
VTQASPPGKIKWLLLVAFHVEVEWQPYESTESWVEVRNEKREIARAWVRAGSTEETSFRRQHSWERKNGSGMHDDKDLCVVEIGARERLRPGVLPSVPSGPIYEWPTIMDCYADTPQSARETLGISGSEVGRSTSKMRVRKLRPRDRSTPARATGAIICDLRLPAIGDNFVKCFVPTSHHAMAGVRRFIVKNLPKEGIGLEGASLVISAAVRSRSGAIGRKRLVTWCSGEEIQAALDRAASEWAQLPKEEWKGEAVEVELPAE